MSTNERSPLLKRATSDDATRQSAVDNEIPTARANDSDYIENAAGALVPKPEVNVLAVVSVLSSRPSILHYFVHSTMLSAPPQIL